MKRSTMNNKDKALSNNFGLRDGRRGPRLKIIRFPAYVLDPHSEKRTYIETASVEPGSELAHAVIAAELNAPVGKMSLREALKRFRSIKRYLLPSKSLNGITNTMPNRGRIEG